MNKTLKKALGVILAVSMLCSAALLSGCGEGDKNQTSTTAPATTAAATTQAAESSSDVQSQDNGAQSSEAQDSAQSSDDQSSNSQSDNDSYINEDYAIQNALAQAGDGAVAVSDYKGYTPEGYPAWVITVQMPDGTNKIYYSGLQFTISEDVYNGSAETPDNDGDYAGISADGASAKAVDALGGGADLVVAAISQGYYNGDEAWVVHVTDNQDNSHIIYVGSDFCYY